MVLVLKTWLQNLTRGVPICPNSFEKNEWTPLGLDALIDLKELTIFLISLMIGL